MDWNRQGVLGATRLFDTPSVDGYRLFGALIGKTYKHFNRIFLYNAPS